MVIFLVFGCWPTKWDKIFSRDKIAWSFITLVIHWKGNWQTRFSHCWFKWELRMLCFTSWFSVFPLIYALFLLNFSTDSFWTPLGLIFNAFKVRLKQGSGLSSSGLWILNILASKYKVLSCHQNLTIKLTSVFSTLEIW